MSDRMSPLDAFFLDAEDEDRHASLAIASIAVLEGPPPEQEEIVEAVARKLPLIPRYRQKLRTRPLDLGAPAWVDDPDFDLRYHVRRTALPAPGDDEALCRLVARLMSQRLDRDRPLWECWVVEGLAGGRWAVLSKVHHCMVDGVAGTGLYETIFDRRRWAPAVAAAVPPPDPGPSTLGPTVDALRGLVTGPIRTAQALLVAAYHPARTVRRLIATASGLAELVRAVAVPAHASSLSGPIGGYRRYAVGRARLRDVRQVGRHFRVTVNDVVLAAVSGAFRSLLLERGERPDPHAIRSLVPVSVRPPGAASAYDNRISMMLPFLPADIADPVQRLKEVHARMRRLKASGEAEAGETMTLLAGHGPFAPVSWGVRLAAHLPQRTVVTVTTNVPGPRRSLYFLGRRLLEIFPYVPIAVRLRIGVAVLTYGDRVTFGVTTDYASAPEAGRLVRDIERGIAELRLAAKAASRPAVGRPR